ncbi:MAG: putative Na+/H+ antiporter [Chlamydiales bacterium]
MDPSLFEIISTVIFALAIAHTFLTPTLFHLSEKMSKKKDREEENSHQWKFYHFCSEIFYLLSEVEVVFGIWLIPLICFFALIQGWEQTVEYLDNRNFTHALYITVIVVIIGSRPIITFSEKILERVARFGKDTPGSWWWTIITLGPLFGAILKEPGAMVLSSILLSKKFYPYQPSRLFKYATLGLLFTNVSVGGMLTTFSSRSLFIIAYRWDWNWYYMLTHFGWKMIIGLLLSNALYYFLFRKEFKKNFPETIRPLKKIDEKERPTPFWITLIHLIFVALVVISGENAPIFVGIFILFLGFWSATSFYQAPLHLKSGILVGFFFAALLIHGELQEWWIIPLIERLDYFGATITSFILSALVDNAIVSYMTADLPQFDTLKHYLVITAAMSAGGLTIMANAPNVVGHAILRSYFKGSISFLYLFLGALAPSLILLTLFWVFK